ncbi:hypothetical protein H0H92_010651 [Tricholoma furcatifolium]|nr:hypothetical protein H0H92_010651 [Tricholoma furcatifolium]
MSNPNEDKDRRYLQVPLCVLAARLLAENETVMITFFTTANYYERTQFELSRQLNCESSAFRRIRLVSIMKPTAPDPKTLLVSFAQSYRPAYEALALERPLTCLTTGSVLNPVPKPTAIIMDITRALSGNNVPIIAWITGGCPTLLRLWGPESFGGLGDQTAKIQAEAARSGRAIDEVANQIYKPIDGGVVRIPGVPAMYDYEFHPQQLPFEVPQAMVINVGREFIEACDASLSVSHEAYEKESLAAVKAWQAEKGKPVYAIGPLLTASTASAQSDISDNNSSVSAFLDDMLNTHGKNSVVFMSFGTHFWPTAPEYLDEVINALLEKKYPFIFAHASPYAHIQPELSEKVKASGIGLLTPWSPQQFILSHQATGWFLTHGGHGGVIESLWSGVPLICWPFDADQPAAAAHISENLKAGFELYEVRTGLGLKPLHRTGRAPEGTREAVGREIRDVLDSCRAEEGEERRRSAQRIQAELHAAWKDDGPAKASLRDFLQRFVKA